MKINIAEDNHGPKWTIEGLHGRQDELDLLNKIAEGESSACVLLEGEAGCGKTTLMHAVNWEQKEWVYVSRKFERHLSSEPYSALTRAIFELVEIWCTNNEKNSPDNCRMSDLQGLLKKDMSLLQNVIPGLFRIIDKFTQRMQLSKSQSMLFLSLGEESQSNFNRSQGMLFSSLRESHQSETPLVERRSSSSIKDLASLLRERAKVGNEKLGGHSAAIAASFLRLFSFLSSDKPIALAFDDIHYADASSMEILKLMAHAASSSNSTKYSNNQMLLVLSYTELLERNRVAFKTIRNIKNFPSNVNYVHLRPWDVDTVNELVTSFFKAEPEESLPLSKVIHKKTGGNPFEVSQFLRFGREKGHFKFSTSTYKWEWGDVEILDQYTEVSDNVAEMLTVSMVQLCFATQAVLKVASCLGHMIPMDVLVAYFAEGHEEESKQSATVVGIQEEQLVELLEGAGKAGILVKSSTHGTYMWSNDRLQQATYESMPVTMRNQLHLKLGRLLQELGLVCDEEWMIFMAANQMNTYALEADSCLGNEVAKLNLQAAILSLNKGAIYPALELLVKAEKHLVEADRWENSYELTLDILTTLAEAKLHIGETQTAMKIATEVVRHAKTLDDTFPAHIIMLRCVVSGNDRNYDMGVERTLWLLKYYGEKHSWKFFPGQGALEKVKLRSKIKKLLPCGELEDLLDLPDMVDKPALRIQTLLVNHLAVYASYSPTYKPISWFASARALKSACKHGISPVTNLAVVQMAAHLRVEGHYKEASEYAEVSLLLTERLPQTLGSDHGQVRMFACGSVFSAVSFAFRSW